MYTRLILFALLLFPIQTFAAAVLPLVGAAGLGAAMGSLGTLAAQNRGAHGGNGQAQYDSTNAPEANANPQNTTSATFQPNYHNQTSPTININVRPIMPLNFGTHSSTNIGSDPLDGEQRGSELNSKTDSSSSNGANPTQSQGKMPWRHGRDFEQPTSQSAFSKNTLCAAGLVTAGVGAIYYILGTNNDDLLNSPHAWHNWKRKELSTIELSALAPEQVGELMAQDMTFAMKRSVSSEGRPGSIPDIIKAIDEELQNLKGSLSKATWAQRLWLGGLCGSSPEDVEAAKKAIERDEILLSQLSRWYAADLSFDVCCSRG